MKRLFLLFIISLVGIQVNAQNETYFPFEAKGHTGFDSFTEKWYSGQLSALREPVLLTDRSEKEIYRFTWLRTFHHPVAIRIEKNGDAYILYWKVCDGAGGYEPGKLIIDKQKEISKASWDKFMQKFMMIGFWAMDTREKELGNDGAQWILEGKLANKYHVVEAWSPRSGNYYECCDFLIGLTDLKIKPDEKY
ncbi:MAG: hypothetical protein ACHQIM_08815 [Sphingobacteriales bacterium]